MTGKIAKMATKTSSKSVYIVSSPKRKCFTDTDGHQWELSLTFPINGYVKKLLKRRSILTHTHTHTMTTVSYARDNNNNNNGLHNDNYLHTINTFPTILFP